MITNKQIEQFLNNIENKNFEENTKYIIDNFGTINYRNTTGQTLFHILVEELHDEKKVLIAIKLLLEMGLNPNLVDSFDYIFIQTAIEAKYSVTFILIVIKISLKYGLNINHVDSLKNTIVHTLINSKNYLNNITQIYKYLLEQGFDTTLVNNLNIDVMELLLINQDNYPKEEVEAFEQLFIEYTNQTKQVEELKTKYQEDKSLKQLKKYGHILTSQIFKNKPTISYDKKIQEIIITLAKTKKSPLIVGESGVGKTALVDELAYLIKNKQVPNFLKNQMILEINPNELVSGTKYVGTFEEKISKLMDLYKKYNFIIFIDDIQDIFGVGTTENKDEDLSSMLRRYMNRLDLKIIGTTSITNYNNYFSKGDFKRRFDKILLEEPTQNQMFLILNKVIKQYLKDNSSFLDKNTINTIIDTIIFLTAKNNRVYNDITNNPDLAISIIDTSFAISKINEENIKIEHFIEAINMESRIYPSVKEKAIFKLSKTTTVNKQKIITFNSNIYRNRF